MRPSLLLVLLAALTLAPGAHARQRFVTDPSLPRELPAEGPVGVRWTDPAQFTELRSSHNRWEAQRGDWVADLARHLRSSAGDRLQPGQTMDITITDIKRAGSFEPWMGVNYANVRVMRDIYIPRMTLEMRVTDADGRVLAEGERRLSDMNYLRGPQSIRSDNLQYEKRMIDDWVRRELSAIPATAQAAR